LNSIKHNDKKNNNIREELEDEPLATSHRARLKNWFAHLSEEERRSIVSVVDKDFCQLLLNMYEKKCKEGDGLFFDVGGQDLGLALPVNTVSATRSRTSSGGTPHFHKNLTRPRQSSHGSDGKKVIVNNRNIFKSFNNNGKNYKRSEDNDINANNGTDKNEKSVKFFDDYFVGGDLRKRRTPANEDNFCFRRQSHWVDNAIFRCLEADEMLIDAVRLCDTKEYLDTMTLSISLLSNHNNFFRVMKLSSRGAFLSKPCKVVWNLQTKRWEWEVPEWFSSKGYYSLATYVAHKVEQMLWIRYWHHFGLDPRRNPHIDKKYTDHNSDYEKRLHYQNLASKTHLLQFWKQMNHIEKRKILGVIGNIVKEVIKEDQECFSYPQLLSILLELSFKTPESLIKKLNNESQFIEFLYFSPLHRADSRLDFVIRRIGLCIQTEYADKLSKDLILGEQSENMKAYEKKARKKQRKEKLREKKKKEKEKKENALKEKQKQEQERKKRQEELNKFLTSIVNEIIDKAELLSTERKQLQLNARKKEKKTQNKPLGSVSLSDKQIPEDEQDREQKCPKKKRRSRSQTRSTKIRKDETSTSSVSSAPATGTDAPQKKPALRRSHSQSKSTKVKKESTQWDTSMASSSSTHPTSPKDVFNMPSPRIDVGSNNLTNASAHFSSSESASEFSICHSISHPKVSFAATKPKSYPQSPRQGQESQKGREACKVPKASPPAKPLTPDPLSPPFFPLSLQSLPSQSPSSISLSSSPSSSSLQQQYMHHPPDPDRLTQRILESYIEPEQYRQIQAQRRRRSITISKLDLAEHKHLYHSQTDRKDSNEPQIPQFQSLVKSHLVNGLIDTKFPRQAISLRKSAPEAEHSNFYVLQNGTLTPTTPTVHRVSSQSPHSHLRVTSFQPQHVMYHQQENFPSSESPLTLPVATQSDPFIYNPTGDSHSSLSLRNSANNDSGNAINNDNQANVNASLDHSRNLLQQRPMIQPQYYYVPPEQYPHVVPHQQPSIYYQTMWGGEYSWISMLSDHFLQSPTIPSVVYPLEERKETVTEKLHKEILRFVDIVTEKVASHVEEHQETVAKIAALVKKLWPKATIEMYGSVATELALPSSDLDLVIRGVPPFTSFNPIVGDRLDEFSHRTRFGNSMLDPLRLLAGILERQPWVKTGSIQCIETAHIPVIKFQTLGDLPVDISFDDGINYHSGIMARDLVRLFMSKFPELKPLALVLKQFLQQRKLNNSYTGGLSSYCLVLMIVSFLQLYGHRTKTRQNLSKDDSSGGGSGGGKNLGAYLLDFLDLYGNKFDFQHVSISVNYGGAHVVFADQPPAPVSSPLMIVDPFNPQNNIGYNAFFMWKVQRAFSLALESPETLIPSLIEGLEQEERAKHKTDKGIT
jgi:non-canonical poly(A) RNA polymerase PAPD5/7